MLRDQRTISDRILNAIEYINENLHDTCEAKSKILGILEGNSVD